MTNSEHPSDESTETSDESTETSDESTETSERPETAAAGDAGDADDPADTARQAVAEDERLQQVGDSIDEAKQAAADVDLPDRDDADAAGS